MDPALVWFRRDLRLDDNPALAAAVRSGRPVLCAFCLDPRIFKGPGAAPIRVRFMLEGLADLDRRLRAAGGALIVRVGVSQKELAGLVRQYGAVEVHACIDEEPFALRRDADAERLVGAAGAAMHWHHDQTAVPHELAIGASGGPCRTYSAYARAVGRVLGGPLSLAPFDPAGALADPGDSEVLPDLARLGLRAPAADAEGGETAGLARLRWWRDSGRIDRYADERDRIADPDATSLLAPYLKLGMLSPRRVLQVAERAGAEKWRSEILWRDWFKYVLHHHPDLEHASVDPRFDRLEWPGEEAHWEAWCRGETGFAIVDAGMRQLVATGRQPNRVRMLCASFLVKHLHIDWRRGERFYREHLLDGDLSANAGSWQWVAGTGLDAAPWFRIFNPLLQQRKFDPDGAYVERWAPDGPAPIVDLAVERARALELYGRVAGAGRG